MGPFHLDELGRSTLWAAVAGNQTEAAEELLDQGVNVNLPSRVIANKPL